MNQDNDMSHTVSIMDFDAREKYLAGQVVSSTTRRWVYEFFEENADLPRPHIWEVWAGPGATLWTLAKLKHS